MLPLRRAPFWGVLAAGGFSRLANAVAAIAYPWLALDLGGPPFAGLVAAVILAPAAFGHLIAGVAVERFGVRPTALAGEGASALSALAIATLAAFGQLTGPLFLILTALGAALDGPARGANQARWPEIARLARTPLPRATALDASADHVATLAGPSLAGMALILWGPISALFLVAGLAGLGFVLAAAAMPAFKPKGGEAGRLAGVAAGWRCIAGAPLLAMVTALGAVAVAAFAALESVVLPALARGDQGAGAAGLTAYLASAGLGALVGAGGMAAWGKTPRMKWLLPIAFGGMAMGVAALAVLPPGAVSMACAGVLIGVSYGGLGPALNTAFLTLPPVHLRAHVGGVAGALVLALAPLAAVGAGLGFAALGGAAMVLIVAAALALAALFSIAAPDLPTKS